MIPKLSLIFPVRNAQHSLQGQVQRLLEVLPEMSSNFELVVVDDGSTDNTDEVANEIAREYPQVRVVRNDSTQGNQRAVESGLKAATGEVVLVHPFGTPASQNDLLRAWRNNARTLKPKPLQPGLIERLQRWAAADKASVLRGRTVAPVTRRWEAAETNADIRNLPATAESVEIEIAEYAAIPAEKTHRVRASAGEYTLEK